MIRDEELKPIENERTVEKKVTFTQDYNNKRGPDHGSEQWARGQDFQRRNQSFSNDRFRRSSPNNYQNFPPTASFTNRNNSSNDRRSFDQRPNQSFNRNDGNRSRHESFNNQKGTGGTMGTFLVLHQIQEVTSHKTIPIAHQEMNILTTSHSADLTIDLQQTLHPMNRNFRRTIIRHHRMWFVLLQPMIL